MPSEDLISKVRLWRERHQDINAARFIKEKNLHLTVLPPWYEKETNLGLLNKLVEKSVQLTNPVVLKFSAIESRCNCLWLKADCPIDFLNLKEHLALSLGQEKTNKETVPHIVLARLKSEFRYKRIWDHGNIDEESFDHLALFESVPGAEGADYNILLDWKLAR